MSLYEKYLGNMLLKYCLDLFLLVYLKKAIEIIAFFSTILI
ncbi:hypothetical protein AC229_1457 [Oenococcus oeni]|nr:hypothetical protein AC229_1457 [Oenococcus oeni]